MRTRVLVAGLVGAVALAAGAWLAARGTATGRPPAGASSPTRPGSATAAEAGHASAARRPTLRRAPATEAPRPGAVTVGGVTIQGAGIYDPESDEVKANLLAFRKSRLRFALYDAAAECWSGGDDVADLQVGYTLVVEAETLRLEGLRLLDSTLPDPALERCIVDRLAELRSPAPEIPDLREVGSSWISLHDLYTRNRRAR
jgi:hypothetical protein